MYWPSPQDYNEAVQTPQTSFADPELQAGALELNQLGLPRAISGSFASVYRIYCQRKQVAVRFFLRHFPDQQERYLAISDFVTADDLPYTVSFEFVERGVRIKGSWYPMLKMDWVEGQSLSSFIEDHLSEPATIGKLACAFEDMMVALHGNGIAHGDLQHGNILVVGNELRLVDYDGMYVPRLSGRTSNEIGHRNYQHPARCERHFGPYLDNFSLWSIRTSLVALSLDPFLWSRLQGGDECLLFRQADYKEPLTSQSFALLETHESQEIAESARRLRFLLSLDLEQIPFVDQEFDLPDHPLQPLSPGTSMPAWLSSWLEEEDQTNGQEDTVIGLSDSSLPPSYAPQWAGAPTETPGHTALKTQATKKVRLSVPGQTAGSLLPGGLIAQGSAPQAVAQAQPPSPQNSPPKVPSGAPAGSSGRATGSADFFGIRKGYLAPTLALCLAASAWILPGLAPSAHHPGQRNWLSPDTARRAAWSTYQKAQNNYKQKKYAEAAAGYKKALSAFQAAGDGSSTGAADCCQFLGRSYYFLDNPGAAQDYFARALKIFEHKEGPKGQRTRQLLHDIGVNSLALKDLKEAAAYFQEELKTRLSCQDGQAMQAASKLAETAVALIKQGDLGAITHFNKAFAQLQEQPGQADALLRDLRIAALALKEKSGNPQAAGEVLMLAVAIAEAHPGQYKTNLIECLEALRDNLTLQGRYSQADQVQLRLRRLEASNSASSGIRTQLKQ